MKLTNLLNASVAALLGVGCTMNPGDTSEGVATTAAPLALVTGDHLRWRVTGNYVNQAGIQATIDLLATNDTNVEAMATMASGDWIIVAPSGPFSTPGIPVGVVTAVQELLVHGQRVRAIDFNHDGDWVVVGDDDFTVGGTPPAGLVNTLNTYINVNGWTVRDVDITNGGYVVLGEGSLANYAGIDADLAAFIADRTASKRQVQVVDIGFDGRWVAVAGQEPAGQGLSSQLKTRLATTAEDEVHVTRLMLGVGNDYIVYSHGAAVPSPGNPIEAIEYGMAGGNLWQQMNALGLPGMSIAIVQNNQVTYARSYGVLRDGEEDHVLASTPFDTGSLSKFLGALVMVKLAENGIVDLDDDVLANPGAIVEEWQETGESAGAPATYGVANVDLPAGMTLRRLMRHQAGLRDENGSPGFSESFWDEAEDATAVELLLGYDCDSDDCGYNRGKQVWRDPANTVGGTPVYASGNFMLAQAIAEDATGDEARWLLGDLFLSAMGLNDITGQIPLPAALEARAAWHHGDGGAVSSRNIHPWIFAGGVYASARDYAKMMILALNQGRDTTGVQRVGAAWITDMLEGNGVNRGFGLRVEGDNATEGTDVPFNHGGSHNQRARSRMCGNPTRNEGIVIMTNGEYDDDADADSTSESDELINAILDAYVADMGWPTGNCR